MTAYIWQKTKLSELSWNSDRLINLLSSVRNQEGKLMGSICHLGLDMQNNTALDYITDDITKSSEIEGVILNAEKVRSSVARNLGIETEGLPTPDHYTEGVVQIMIDAIKNYHQPLTHERLFGWHAALFPMGFSGTYKITVAAYRKGDEPMLIVSGPMGKEKIHYEAPPSDQVDELMNEFLFWINNENNLDSIIKAAIAHLWFVIIHPFDDGNGRLGRTITDILLSRADETQHRYYSISTEILQNKKEYYAVLEKVSSGNGDITEWLEWFLLTMKKALDKSETTILNVIKKSKFWNDHSHVAMNERQVKVVNKLLMNFTGKLNTSKWAKMTKSSQATALRDINDLIQKDILVKSEDGGRSTNYELKLY